MIARLWPLLLLALAAPLRAQDEPVHMRPEFALCFPLAQNGRDVTVKYPVLINPVTVLKPGMQLRVLYILNHDSGDGADLALAHAGTLEQSYARNAFSGGGDPAKLPPEMAHEIEGYRRTVWEVPNNFVLAMAQYPTEAMHLIYSPTAKNSDLHDERFSFFDGLFVGSPDGHVAVVAVEKHSKAEAAGIKAGDDIVSVGGIPVHDDLHAFAAAYSAAKRTAAENELDAYAVVLQTAQGEQSVSVAMPPRIKSGLMDDFFNQPPQAVKTAPSAPAGSATPAP